MPKESQGMDSSTCEHELLSPTVQVCATVTTVVSSDSSTEQCGTLTDEIRPPLPPLVNSIPGKESTRPNVVETCNLVGPTEAVSGIAVSVITDKTQSVDAGNASSDDAGVHATSKTESSTSATLHLPVKQSETRNHTSTSSIAKSEIPSFPLFKKKQLQSQILIVTSKSKQRPGGVVGTSGENVARANNNPKRTVRVESGQKTPKRRKIIDEEEEDDEEEDDEEEDDEEEDDEDDTEGSLAEFIEHDSEEEDKDSSYSEQVSDEEKKPRSESSVSQSSETDESSTDSDEASSDEGSSEDDGSHDGDCSDDDGSREEDCSDEKSCDEITPVVNGPSTQMDQSEEVGARESETCNVKASCTRKSDKARSGKKQIHEHSTLSGEGEPRHDVVDLDTDASQNHSVNVEGKVRRALPTSKTGRLTDARQDVKTNKPKRSRKILESEDEQVILKQYTPQMETEGSIETNGRRVSTRANKGRPPTRYVDENFVEFMLDDVEVDLLLEESESTADN